MKVSIETGTNLVKMFIADNGSGIPEQNIEKVWIPYITFKKGGTGLGLPVVKRIIESMNGTISVSSSTGCDDHGTAFTIIFNT
jgi:nitrogen fixation/metabolism regulation signal transduction histidine kinase